MAVNAMGTQVRDPIHKTRDWPSRCMIYDGG